VVVSFDDSSIGFLQLYACGTFVCAAWNLSASLISEKYRFKIILTQGLVSVFSFAPEPAEWPV
jgi:hypothetical protein